MLCKQSYSLNSIKRGAGVPELIARGNHCSPLKSHVPITHQLGSGGDTQLAPDPQHSVRRGQAGWQQIPGRGQGLPGCGGSREHSSQRRRGPMSLSPWSHHTSSTRRAAGAQQPDLSMGLRGLRHQQLPMLHPRLLANTRLWYQPQRSGFTETRLSGGSARAPAVTQQGRSPHRPPLPGTRRETPMNWLP